MEIISKFDKGETGISLARFYNVGKATITDVKKNRDINVSFYYKEAIKYAWHVLKVYG